LTWHACAGCRGREQKSTHEHKLAVTPPRSTQYFGFSTFNKVDGSIWTLTRTRNQAWTVAAGMLLANGNLAAAPDITVKRAPRSVAPACCRPTRPLCGCQQSRLAWAHA